MCGRDTLFADCEDLEERFDVRFESPFAPRGPTPRQRLPVCTDAEPETACKLESGFVSHWAGDDRGVADQRAGGGGRREAEFSEGRRRRH